MSISDLSKRFALEGLTIEGGRGGLTRLKLETELCSAELYLQGAHLTQFQPKDSAPILWMSQSSYYEKGKPIRGGVPICFPWFGPNSKDSKAPSHGWARLTEWELLDCRLGITGEVVLTLGCTIQGFQLRYCITLSRTLRMAMSVELSAEVSNEQSFESALHTYLLIEDIHRISIDGLENSAYWNKVGTPALSSASHSSIRFNSETDRVYGDTETTCQVNDPGMGRTIRISKLGSRSTVIWNPWIEKSQRMKDFGDDEWRTMVCVETANVGSNAVSLKPGQTHTMTTELEAVPNSFAS